VNDSIPQPASLAPRKQTTVLRWLAAAAILFIAWFCWQLFRPNPPIRVSHETTRIIAPLLPNGLPDYKTHALNRSREGVTPENNAAVLMWQAMGPGTGSDAIAANEWEALCNELQIIPAESPADYLPPLYCRDNRRAIAAWLHEQGRLRTTDGQPSDVAVKEVITSDSWPLKSDGAMELYDVVELQIDNSVDAPWTTEQLPPLASWLEEHQAQLDLLVEASRRTKLYSPDPGFITSDDQEMLLTMSLEYVQRVRELSRLLNARAMWLLGEGRYEQAWENLLAIHRWARLTCHGSTIVEQLVGIAIDGIACRGTVVLLSDRNLPPEIARRIQRDLSGLAPTSDMASSFDEMERLYELDSIVMMHRVGAGSMLGELAEGERLVPWLKTFDYMTFDWNALLVEANHRHDRFAAVGRLPNWEAKMQEIDLIDQELVASNSRLHDPRSWIAGAFSRTARSRMFADTIMDWWLPPLSACLTAEDRSNTQIDLAQLAAALAVYRTEHGTYPDSIEQLVPDVVPNVPTDLYHSQPFIYQRNGDGYLLYSTGPNGTDDGGSNEQREILAGNEIGWTEDDATEELRQQIPAGADDIAIRVPRPPFQLPTPPTQP
jgi:hypothetical protein